MLCTVKCFESTLNSPPPLGSTITVKHHGVYATGTLKNPVYWRDKSSVSSTIKIAEGRNHKEFFDRSAQVMNISHPTDWYKVKREDVYNMGGQKLLQQHYGNSLYKALNHLYPDTEIFPTMLYEKDIPKGFWKCVNNHRKFYDHLFIQLGYKCMDDWYNVMQDDIYKNGGEGLLIHYYDGSPSVALQKIYPDHNWDMKKFRHKPQGLWKESQKEFFDSLYSQLGHKDMSDWYNVTKEDIYQNGGKSLLTYYYGNSPSSALQSVYPQHHWELDRFKNKPRRC